MFEDRNQPDTDGKVTKANIPVIRNQGANAMATMKHPIARRMPLIRVSQRSRTRGCTPVRLVISQLSAGRMASSMTMFVTVETVPKSVACVSQGLVR